VQITVNEPYVANRARIGAALMLLGFLALVVGFIVSLMAPTQPGLFVLPWFTLGIAIFLLNLGKFYQSRFGTRPDRALTQALKGLDAKYHLYSFVKGLPTEHLLATPNGVVVLEVRPFSGDVINEGAKWSRPLSVSGFMQLFADGSVGNPTKDAEADVAAVRKVLRERLGETIAAGIPVAPLIVLTSPRVKPKISEPAVPVVMIADLRAALRRLREGGRVPPDIQRQLARALEADQGNPHDALSTSRSKPWQRTQK
jgi:hypothetical protein